jgi:hypothetical protein
METIWQKLSPDHRRRLKEVLPRKLTHQEQLRDHSGPKWWLYKKARDKMSGAFYWAIQVAANARLLFGNSIGIQVRDVREWGTFNRFHLQAGWPFEEASVGTFLKDQLNCPITDEEFAEGWYDDNYRCPDDIITSRRFRQSDSTLTVPMPIRPVSQRMNSTRPRTWDSRAAAESDSRAALDRADLHALQSASYQHDYDADLEEDDHPSSSVCLSSTGLSSSASSSSSSSPSSSSSSSSQHERREVAWDGSIDPTLKPRKYVNRDLFLNYKWRPIIYKGA